MIFNGPDIIPSDFIHQADWFIYWFQLGGLGMDADEMAFGIDFEGGGGDDDDDDASLEAELAALQSEGGRNKRKQGEKSLKIYISMEQNVFRMNGMLIYL